MADEKAAKAAKDDAENKGADGESKGAAAAEGVDAAEAGKPRKGKKKLVLLLVAVTVLLLGGGGAGLYFSGMLGGQSEAAVEDAAAKKKKEEKNRKAYFYDLGDMIVNLTADGRRPSLLKLKMSLELEDEKDRTAMDQVKPRVLDSFQAYMRELRVEDLKGSAGIYRLREELLLRVTEVAYPAKVRDVLIMEMLVQ